MTGIPDPNDNPGITFHGEAQDPATHVPTDAEPHPLGVNRPTDRPEPPTLKEFVAALGRVLDHAESNGEVYVGAVTDHALLRQAYYAAANYDDGPLSIAGFSPP